MISVATVRHITSDIDEQNGSLINYIFGATKINQPINRSKSHFVTIRTIIKDCFDDDVKSIPSQAPEGPDQRYPALLELR